MSPSSLLVAKTLFRFYRPAFIWFIGFLVVGTAVAMTIVDRLTTPTVSIWLLVAGSALKYWVLIVGIMVVVTHLRQFVINGITRRDVMAGGALFGGTVAVIFAALVPIGHGLERALLSLAGPVSPEYPAFSAGIALREFGHFVPQELAFLVAGLAIAAGFYRYGGWPGVLFLVPGALPVVVAEGLTGVDDEGQLQTRLLSTPVAVVVLLVVTALVAVLYQREIRDVPIRPVAG
jgi:hypothetical protein